MEEQMPLAKTLLNEFAGVLTSVPDIDIQRLRDTLIQNPKTLGGKYYEDKYGEEKYCLYAILAGINTIKWATKSKLEKIRYAWYYAMKHGSLIEFVNGIDQNSCKILSLETFIQDRMKLCKNPLLTPDEVNDLIDICDKQLKDKN